MLSPRSRSRLDSIVLSSRRATKIDIAVVELGNLTRPVHPSYVHTLRTNRGRSCHCVGACGPAEPLLSGLMMMPMIRYLAAPRADHLDN